MGKNKILLVHHKLPWPLDNGMDKLRYNLIRTLKINYRITLIVPVENEISNDVRENFEKITDELILVKVDDIYRNKKAFVYKRLFNLIFLNTPAYIYNYYSDVFFKYFHEFVSSNQYKNINFLSDFSAIYSLGLPTNINVIIGPMDDTIETNYNNMCYSTTLRKKSGYWLEYKATIKYFKRICVANNKLLFHSAEDIDRVSKRIKSTFNALTLKVATETEEVLNSETAVEKNSLVFVGGMGSFFNQDAVQYFCEYIFPFVKKEISDVKFYVVGSNPSDEILALNDKKSVFIIGEVKDVMPYILKAALYISPIRCGTGIKTKMVEAFKAGKAIIATNLALQGLWQINSNAMLIENSPEKFAEAIIRVLQDGKLSLNMSKESLKLYSDYYSFTKVAPDTLNTYSKIIK